MYVYAFVLAVRLSDAELLLASTFFCNQKYDCLKWCLVWFWISKSLDHIQPSKLHTDLKLFSEPSGRIRKQVLDF